MDEHHDHWIWGYRLLRGVALLFFIAAIFVGMGWATIDHHAVFVPAGLFFWCLSNGVP